MRVQYLLEDAMFKPTMKSPDFSAPMPVQASPMCLPQASSHVRAGFPSPADDVTHARVDLAQELVLHPQCTFILRVAGDSMRDAGILDGDLLVVDRVLRPAHGDIVVAEVDGEFTCKRLQLCGGWPRLCAANPAYPDICLQEGQHLTIWGVVTSSITRHRRW